MDDPTQLPPIALEVYDFEVLKTNAVWVRLQFDDGAYLGLEFAPDSPLCHDLIALLERAANDMLGRLGQRGITLTGFTPPEVEEDES
jgi:hypothetical protein